MSAHTPYRKIRYICGIDEAGRGPLAGDVFAAAVVLSPEHAIPGLTDSKKLTEKKRIQLAEEIKTYALAYGVGRASVAEIDEMNILQASLLAMKRAYDILHLPIYKALIDGNQKPSLDCICQTIVQGDQLEPAISAASILAKTERDRYCLDIDKYYPQYGFRQHKGYGTTQHLQALERYGACPLHRFSFGPVRRAVELRPHRLVQPIEQTELPLCLP